MLTPVLSSINLTTQVTGILPVANGGTNLSALGTSLQYLRTNVGATGLEYATLPAGVSGSNPSASVGLAAVNGSASTFLRSDGAPALSQTIAPNWTGQHIFSAAIGTAVTISPPAAVVGLSIALDPSSSANGLLVQRSSGTTSTFCMDNAGRAVFGSSSVNNAAALSVTSVSGGIFNIALRIDVASAGETLLSAGGNGIIGVDASGVALGRWSLLENGNVGYGVPAPTARLNINGTFLLSSNSSASTMRQQASLVPSWVDATDATRKARTTFNVYDTAVHEAIRIEADGSFALTSIGGAATATATTLSVTSPSTSYIGLAVNGKQVNTPVASTTGSPTLFTLTGPAHTTLTASAEATDINLNLARTVQFATGTLANQRAIRIQAPTYAFVGASTITTAATLSISGTPVVGTNATITNGYSLLIEGGTIGVRFAGGTVGVQEGQIYHDGFNTTYQNKRTTSGTGHLFVTDDTNGFFGLRVNGYGGTNVFRAGGSAGVGLRVGSDRLIGFSSSTNSDVAYDTASGRNAAGVVEINNGTAGRFGGLICGNYSASTNAIANGLTIGTRSSGTPAAGLGAGLLFTIDSSTTANQSAGLLTSEWVVATHATRIARTKLSVYDATAAREAFRMESDGLRAWAGVPAGNSTSFGKVGGTIFDHYVNAGNTTTTETDLYSDTIPASTLASNGDKLQIEYGGVFVSSATATRQVKVYFAGTVILDTGALTLTLSSAWCCYASIIRVSSTVIRYSVSMTTEGAALAAYTAVGELTGLTLTNTNILKITGQAAGTGAATNDIVAKSGYISWEAAA